MKQNIQTKEQKERLMNGLFDPELMDWGCGTFLEKKGENTDQEELWPRAKGDNKKDGSRQLSKERTLSEIRLIV